MYFISYFIVLAFKCIQKCSHIIRKKTFFLQNIGDVRGKGLMIGVEMVTDKESKTPLPAEKMVAVWEDCKDMKLLLGKGGLNGNVFRIKPPMCITKEDVHFAIQVFRFAVEKNLGK